jgi:thimet oligopeptidase
MAQVALSKISVKPPEGIVKAIRFLTVVAIALITFASTSYAQDLLKSQPPLWTGKPDITAFEKIENDRLSAAQRSIDAMVAVKAAHTIGNTLAPYDQAIERINAASYFADLTQSVHPDAGFRDHATAMVSKASAANTALSLNQEVYKALAALDVSKADTATQYYGWHRFCPRRRGEIPTVGVSRAPGYSIATLTTTWKPG